MGVGVFHKTKLTDSIYISRSAGYKVIATLAPSWHRGSVALFYRDSHDFAVEAICQFIVNIIACQLATRERQWYIVGCYLAPGDDITIRDVKAEMAERPRGAELILPATSTCTSIRRLVGDRTRILWRQWQR